MNESASLCQTRGRVESQEYVPRPRIERAALGVRVNVRREGHARRKGAPLSILLPPSVVVGVDGAQVTARRHLAILRLPASGVVLKITHGLLVCAEQA